MINRAKLRQFEDAPLSDYTDNTCNLENNEFKSINLPSKLELSGKNYADLPRDEIENYRKERE
jgi:hypothetical protein